MSGAFRRSSRYSPFWKFESYLRFRYHNSSSPQAYCIQRVDAKDVRMIGSKSELSAAILI